MIPVVERNEDLVHWAFGHCCVKARSSPKLLEDLCGLNLDAHVNDIALQFFNTEIPELMCWFGRQVCQFHLVNGFKPH